MASVHEDVEDKRPEAAKGGLKVETWIFLALTAFFILAGIVYTIFAGDVEPVGVVALFLTAGLTLIVGSFLGFVSRRLEKPRPEDDNTAEVSDGAGDIGFFSPASYWPIGIAASAALLAVATAFLLVWLMIIATGFLLYAVAGLLVEYQRKPAH